MTHRFLLVLRVQFLRRKVCPIPPLPDQLPIVTVQLPLYNEQYVAERLLRAAAGIDYPADKLQIQVLDDSTDQTRQIVDSIAAELREKGVWIDVVRRPNREGYKAGALRHGLEQAAGEFTAIFDADFIPEVDFVKTTIGYFSNPKVGMVQARWGHNNGQDNLLTQIQQLFLDGHFFIEQLARYGGGLLFNFNGTAGIWRKCCIIEAGNWQNDTITEDLDLSYRAQLAGWKFIYVPEYEVKGDVPGEILAYKSQQKRWAEGAMQTCRKVLPLVWRSSLPLQLKFEATMHLLCHTVQFFVAALTIMNICFAIWVIFAQGEMPQMQLGMGIPLLVIPLLFFMKTLDLSKRFRFHDLVIAFISLPIGIGMSLNHGLAVMRGLFGNTREFIRTAKNIPGGVRSYESPKELPLTIFEGMIALSFIVLAGIAALRGMYWLAPGLLFQSFGFGFIAILSLKELGMFSFQRKAKPAISFVRSRETNAECEMRNAE